MRKASGSRVGTIIARTYSSEPKPPPTAVGLNLQDKPEIRKSRKLQDWFIWKCKYKLPRKPHARQKLCTMKIEGDTRGLVEHSSDQHWNKHFKETNQ